MGEATLATSTAAYLVVRGMGHSRCTLRVRNGLLKNNFFDLHLIGLDFFRRPVTSRP